MPSDGPPQGPPWLEAAMADPVRSLVVDRASDDLAPDATCVPAEVPAMVCFGGLANGTAAAPFEFVRQTSELGVHRVFVRDLGQCWYQRGLPGTSEGVAATARHLAAVLDDLSPSRRVFVGNSSGAFAAVLFGVLAGADEIVAFATQASITRIGRLRSRDRRWPGQVSAARRASNDRSHVDLVRLLESRPYTGQITVHHGDHDPMDTRSAHRLGRIPGVAVVSHAGGHLFIRKLRERNELLPILAEALRPSG